MSRLFVRRSATALGIYSSFVFGVLGTVAATRELPTKQAFGDFATVIFATALVQSFFDLTVEEALVKYGFRYVTREDWGRLRRLFVAGLRTKLVGSALGAIGILVFAAFATHRLVVPLLLASPLPLAQSLEGWAGVPLYLRSRYDVRSFFQCWSMLLRLAGIAIGAHYGVAEAVGGALAAQAMSTVSLWVVGRAAFRRFPREQQRPLADDRREIVRFVAQSSATTGVTSLRSGLAPLLLGAVAGGVQVGYLKVAQMPQTTFATLSAPFRMVLLTEQTRDWERGEQAAVLRGVRRYSLAMFAACIVLVPPLLIWIPDVIRLVNGARYVSASGAARVFVVAAAVQLVVGWSKSFAVSIGRPDLRVWTHGLEAVVVLALVVPLGSAWGATGAAGAILAGGVVYALAWVVLFLRIVPTDGRPGEGGLEGEEAGIEAELGVLAR